MKDIIRKRKIGEEFIPAMKVAEIRWKKHHLVVSAIGIQNADFIPLQKTEEWRFKDAYETEGNMFGFAFRGIVNGIAITFKETVTTKEYKNIRYKWAKRKRRKYLFDGLLKEYKRTLATINIS